jgi:hypothetical protein
MKKISLFFLLLLVIVFSCKKEENTDPKTEDNLNPLQQKWGFALNYTATWCYYCGEWGAPLIHEFADTGNVVAITVHANGDPMYNASLYNSFSSVRNEGSGIPSFWVGDVKTTEMSVMTNLLEQAPVAAIAIQSAKSGDSLIVKTKVRFYEADSNDYYLSVLILENGIDGSSTSGEYEQNGTSIPDSYMHDFVLRSSNVAGSAYGEMIISNPGSGTEILNQYTIYINNSWVDVYPVAILWRMNMSAYPIYQFVNAVK